VGVPAEPRETLCTRLNLAVFAAVMAKHGDNRVMAWDEYLAARGPEA
jgi:hypothetical protein